MCRVLRDLCPIHRLVFLIPADDTFVEDFHIAEPFIVQNAIGQTGQVMRASSI